MTACAEMNTGKKLFDAYRARHATDDVPSWSALSTIQRKGWESWTKHGGRCQSGVILKHRPKE